MPPWVGFLPNLSQFTDNELVVIKMSHIILHEKIQSSFIVAPELFLMRKIKIPSLYKREGVLLFGGEAGGRVAQASH